METIDFELYPDYDAPTPVFYWSADHTPEGASYTCEGCDAQFCDGTFCLALFE